MQQLNSAFGKEISFTNTKCTHTHNFGHLILPLQGRLSILTKYQEIILNDHYLLIIHPDCKHTFYAKDRNQFLVFYIPAYMFPDIGDCNQINYLELDTRWRALRYLMLSEIQDKKNNCPAINDLLYYSFRLAQLDNEVPSIRYIHEHYSENITLEFLAKLEKYNICYFGQWFKKKTGVTPHIYIQNVRLNEAKRLLRETNYSLLDITHQIGYEHQTTLTRLFQKFEGITPKDYRQKFYK